MARFKEINGVKCWLNSQEIPVPPRMIKDSDKKRDRFVEKRVSDWKKEQARLKAFKTKLFKEFYGYVSEMLAQHGVNHGGEKGNVTVRNYSGNLRIELQVANLITFNEEISAAKAIIDACIHEWSKGVNVNLSALILQAFQVDDQGKVSVSKVLGLRRVAIKDERWKRAMEILTDAITIESTKKYIRVYERSEEDGQWQALSLDFAAL